VLIEDREPQAAALLDIVPGEPVPVSTLADARSTFEIVLKACENPTRGAAFAVAQACLPAESTLFL
jgi:hypothetical protein